MAVVDLSCEFALTVFFLQGEGNTAFGAGADVARYVGGGVLDDGNTRPFDLHVRHKLRTRLMIPLAL
jgi:hypothetical protein